MRERERESNRERKRDRERERRFTKRSSSRTRTARSIVFLDGLDRFRRERENKIATFPQGPEFVPVGSRTKVSFNSLPPPHRRAR